VLVVLLIAVCTGALANRQSPYEALEAPLAGVDRFMQQTPGMQPVVIANQGVGMPDQMPPMPVLSRIATIVAEPNQNEDESDPEMIKLNQALEAVKEDIMGNNKQILDENRWMEAVQKITESYQDKMERVTEHVRLLRHEQRQLFEKKKQIENLKLQHKLEKKLTEANDEMSSLRATLEKVQSKSHELHTSHSSLQKTIVDIQEQLAKLQGQETETEEGEGTAEERVENEEVKAGEEAAGGGEEVLA